MHPILILDYHCPAPYDVDSLITEGLGGTEATIIQIAEKLGEKVPVVVAQHNRLEITRSKNVTYSPHLLNFPEMSWQAVIVAKDPSIAAYLRLQYKKAPIWVWMHDLLHVDILSFLKFMADHNIGFIVVSDFQRKLIEDLSKIDPLLPRLPKIERIYNPIADDLKPDDTPVDYNKLIFISTPFKGLQDALKAFELARKRNPKFEFFVAKPTYAQIDLPDLPGVTYLGTISHSKVIAHLRSSLCQFSINHLRPETFGLVFAEANAVGTPVLTHPFGAAPEVLRNHDQLINTHDLNAVVDRLMEWHSGKRPKVKVNEDFRLSNVIKQWERLLLKMSNE